MRYRDINEADDKILDLIESASAGATAAGNIASISQPMGAVMRRPSLFGYIPADTPKKRKKINKRS